MKNIFYMMALVATMGVATSCSQDEEFAVPSVNESNTIAFATSKAKGLTRSGESITSLNKFTVSAVNNDNTSFFENEEFTYNTSAGVFNSQTPHYWPTTGNLSFYAISTIGSYAKDANNIPTYTYTNWAAEKDLVAATVKAGEKEIPYPLTFRHVTSQIYVSAEAENKSEVLNYNLVSVKMTAPSTGTYSFANTTGGVGTWVIDNTKTTEYSYDGPLPMSFKQNGQIELSSCYWNILPSTDGELYFRIEYQVLQNGKVIADYTGNKFKECTVKNPGLVAGKQYRYNFILTRSTNDEITFNATVTDWSDGNTTNQKPNVPVAEIIAVDLGLPSGLKWAKTNLGAEKETDPGLYYAWGETVGYERNSGHIFSSASYTASKIAADLTSSQDAACTMLGGTWRMPTRDEFNELLDNTDKSWTSINGVSGYKFSNKTDATKFIFLPAAGMYEGSTLQHWGIYGRYWSSTYLTVVNCWYLAYGETFINMDPDKRYYGRNIRAVCSAQ